MTNDRGMPMKYGKNTLYWASPIDPAALAQADRTARMPFVAGHVALMPDAHVGIGSTVGCVIPTSGAIMPAAVGVDIGCGMIATETAYRAEDLPDDLGPLLRSVARAIPAGVGKGHAEHRPYFGPIVPSRFTEHEERVAFHQFGSLGSGNHFVEVSVDERGMVWTVLHSGSRGVGNQLARKHIEGAKGLMKERMVSLEDPDLAYFTEGTPEFDAYVQDMLWAQDYARASRVSMNDALLLALRTAIDGQPPAPGWRKAIVVQTINCHHNYCVRESHDGQDVWLTRKGAISAEKGQLGVIPGSMGTDTFIVRGLGSPASYSSSSHGAGRRMSRSEAKRRLDIGGLKSRMEGKAWNEASAAALIDEDPRAYKDIHGVMADQADLSEVEHTLRSVLNYKGFK